jgi:hypothetical protein
MKAKWMVVILFVLLILAFVFYRSRRSEDQLNVDPHARGEIEKAKGR